MFDSLPLRRVALVALAALVVLSGAVASAPVTADVSPTEIDRSPASMAETTTADENVSVEFVYKGDRLTLQQAENQTVRMRTNADSSKNLSVELLVDGAFAALALAPVGEDGTATATFDLRKYDPGTEFAVVGPDGTRADGVIVETPNGTATTTTTVDESEFAFTTTTTATATTTDTRTDDGDTTDHDDNDGVVPGFGVPAALAALLAALALARQRRQ